MATTAKRKPGTATARMHNWTPKGVTRKTANKGRKRAASKGRKRTGKKRGRKRNPQSTSTALAVRAPQTVAKATRAATKKNPARRAKRNPSGGGLSQYRLKGNPSFSDLGSLGKIALVGFGGGLLARTNSAVVLAVVRRFGGAQGAAIANHVIAKPVVTALAGWFLVPRELKMAGVRSEQSHKVAQIGAVLFAAADMVDIFFSGVNSIPDRLAEIIGGGGPVVTNPKTAIAQKAAASAAQSAANAGLSDDDIAAAAQGAYEGTLAGIPQVDDLVIEDSTFLYA
jgi:hypothetical protein